MKGYATPIEKEIMENKDLKRVLKTGKSALLVLMSLHQRKLIKFYLREIEDPPEVFTSNVGFPT